MLIADSSAGSEDFTLTLMEKFGELLVHGSAVMAGKPALLAAVGGRPIVGIPGYPVSAEEDKNGCVMLVKRFIDIPSYLKWDRGGGIP